jgi:hypothetical protein
MLVLAAPLVDMMVGRVHTSAAAQRFNATIGVHAMHLVTVPEFNDWGDALDLIQQQSAQPEAPAWRTRRVGCPWGPTWPSPLGGVRSITCYHGRNATRPLASSGSAAIVGVYRWYVKRALVESGALERFDWFIATRTDSLLLCELRLPPVETLALAVRDRVPLALVPRGEDWGGLTERFIIGTRGAILAAMTTIEAWVTGQAALATNPEGQLQQSLRDACVSILRVPRTTFVVQPLTRDVSERRLPTHLTAVRRTQRADGEAPFEAMGSNWGGCMHVASHDDVAAFGVPMRWTHKRPPIPEGMQREWLCPKYSAAWWLTERTCNASGAISSVG